MPSLRGVFKDYSMKFIKNYVTNIITQLAQKIVWAMTAECNECEGLSRPYSVASFFLEPLIVNPEGDAAIFTGENIAPDFVLTLRLPAAGNGSSIHQFTAKDMPKLTGFLVKHRFFAYTERGIYSERALLEHVQEQTRYSLFLEAIRAQLRAKEQDSDE